MYFVHVYEVWEAGYQPGPGRYGCRLGDDVS